MNYGFREAYFEYFESCDFSRENTNIDVSVFMFNLRMINKSSECEYDWYWKISACSTEYEVCDSFVSFTRLQASYSGSAGWYFRYQSIHIQITNTYHGGQFYWWSKPEKTTDKLYHIMLYTSPWSWFELTRSVAIGTGCKGSCISNYHTIRRPLKCVRLIIPLHSIIIQLSRIIYSCPLLHCTTKVLGKYRETFPSCFL